MKQILAGRYAGRFGTKGKKNAQPVAVVPSVRGSLDATQ